MALLTPSRILQNRNALMGRKISDRNLDFMIGVEHHWLGQNVE
jgi:hypothetical protein